MIQDIITYTIVFYALAYVVRSVALMFIPEGKRVEETSHSSCAGCSARSECSPGVVHKKLLPVPGRGKSLSG